MWNIRSFLFANQANVLTRRRDNCDTVRKAKEIRGMRGLKVDIEKFRKQFRFADLQTFISRANLNMVGPTITYYTLLS